MHFVAFGGCGVLAFLVVFVDDVLEWREGEEKINETCVLLPHFAIFTYHISSTSKIFPHQRKDKSRTDLPWKSIAKESKVHLLRQRAETN